MAIISFWSGERKVTGQTLSMVAIATQMCIERNMRTLIVNSAFNDDTMERCFWNFKQNASFASRINAGKVDIASGAEGLVSAIASNKTSPEIISNYTKIIFKNRLDVLPGLKTRIFEEYEKSMMLYKDLLNAANKYYDLVFVDLAKGLDRDIIKTILENSAVVIYTMTPNLKQIDNFIQFKESPWYRKGNMIPLLTMSDDNSKYNVKNVTRYIGEKNTIPTVPYNTLLLENASEAGIPNMFLQLRLSSAASQDKNMQFVKSVSDCGKEIIYKLQELQYKV